MSNKTVYLTEKGLKEIENELEYLKMEKRPEIIKALKEARALGDLSENAEYDAARNEQAIAESRIKELEAMLDKAEVISNVSTNVVSIGSKVKIQYIDDNEIDEYTIVGSKEADPFSNKISNESPIAKAIIGLEVGNTVSVDSPNGKYDVKIIEISI